MKEMVDHTVISLLLFSFHHVASKDGEKKNDRKSHLLATDLSRSIHISSPMAKQSLESDRRGEILGKTKARVLFPQPDPFHFQGAVQIGSDPDLFSFPGK